MKRITYHFVLIIFFSIIVHASFAQLPGTCGVNNPKIIIAGDSWAQYMADDGTHTAQLSAYGHADKIAISQTYETIIGCSSNPSAGDYAISGSEARQWADPAYPYMNDLLAAVSAYSNVEYVLLSIGGNDILAGKSGGGWYKDMDLDVPGSEAALFSTVQANTQYIIDQILSVRPDMKIILSSYDYPNFNVNILYCGFYACPKREDLSRDPVNDLVTDQEINAMMAGVEGTRLAMTGGNVYYASGMGLMQYYYGSNDSGYNLPPFAVPLPSPFSLGGNPSYPSDRDNFRWIGVCGTPFPTFPADPIHLDFDGYEYKIKHQMDDIFFEAFRNTNGDPITTFWSDGNFDGYVDANDNDNVNYNGIKVGDAGVFSLSDYRGILSFNTGALPDNAQVTGASIYMIRSGAFDNPLEQSGKQPRLDIKKGYFGSPALENSDGTEAASASNIGCFHGEAVEDNHAIRIDVDPSAFSHFNNLGPTQFRFYFTNADLGFSDYVNFYDGQGAPAAMPQEEADAVYVPVYESRVVERRLMPDGKIIEKELSKGEEVKKRKGTKYSEKAQRLEVVDDNTSIIYYNLVTSPDHQGLAKHMSDAWGAPGGGAAPFLDLTYILGLPIELVDFSAVAKGKDALLNWETASEKNGRGFEIQRSKDAEHWQRIGFVDAEGDTDELINYSFVDTDPMEGINYYRLRLVDWDDKEDFSSIKSVVFRGGPEIVSVTPNPFQDQLSISFQLSKSEKVMVQITDMLGSLVAEENLNIQEGENTHTIRNLAHLPHGTYSVKIFTSNGSHSTKVVKR